MKWNIRIKKGGKRQMFIEDIKIIAKGNISLARI